MATDEKTVTLMTRVEITASEWVEIRKRALEEGTTTPQLIGRFLRERLEQDTA